MPDSMKTNNILLNIYKATAERPSISGVLPFFVNRGMGQASRLPASAKPTLCSRWRARRAGQTPALLSLTHWFTVPACAGSTGIPPGCFNSDTRNARANVPGAPIHGSTSGSRVGFRTVFVLFAASAVFTFAPAVFAAVIGTNPPAQPLTTDRVERLPVEQRAEWENYLARSDAQRRTDQRFLQREMKQHGIKKLIIPPEGRHHDALPLHRSADWYASESARHIADVVVSFQTPAGGWSKNLNMTGNLRAPGMHFAPDNNSKFLEPGDFDKPRVRSWNYVGTFDNDATTTQLRFLANVIAAKPNAARPYRFAFDRGLHYIFNAQFPNGGWPQVWPLQGGYHDGITFNDNAMANILNLLQDVSCGTNEFAFVTLQQRAAAGQSLKRGIECILKTQIVVNGHPTAWAQQYDPLTLEPASARNYEIPSEASGESAGVMMFLMTIPRPDTEIVKAVNAAAAWFEKTKITGEAFEWSGGSGRHLVSSPGHGPLWARYCQIGTDRPIFGDRNKTIHDGLNDISEERRNGYAWYVNAPATALKLYESWRKTVIARE